MLAEVCAALMGRSFCSHCLALLQKLPEHFPNWCFVETLTIFFCRLQSRLFYVFLCADAAMLQFAASKLTVSRCKLYYYCLRRFDVNEL